MFSPGGAQHKATDRILRGIITEGEFQGMVSEAVETYLADDDPRDDIDLLIAYAMNTLEAVAADPLDGDRTIVGRFERSVRAKLLLSVARADLEHELSTISARGTGDAGAMDALVGLCRSGLLERPRLFIHLELAEQTLWTAYELAAVPALVEAVFPYPEPRGQIGNPTLFAGRPRKLAFNLLASLAARFSPTPSPTDTVGPEARDALIELAGHLETAGSAVVRLPVHLLTREQRGRLHEYLEAYEDVLRRDPILLPGHGAERLPDVIRGVLWQANDAARFE